VLLAASLHYLIHWPTRGGYNFVSGPLADITLITAFAGTLYLFLRKHNCHVHRCCACSGTLIRITAIRCARSTTRTATVCPPSGSPHSRDSGSGRGVASGSLADEASSFVAPDWSPDGRKIVFVSDRDGCAGSTFLPGCNREIYVMDADGSGQRNLTRYRYHDVSFAWSPTQKK
jgi:hypothetical protein